MLTVAGMFDLVEVRTIGRIPRPDGQMVSVSNKSHICYAAFIVNCVVPGFYSVKYTSTVMSSMQRNSLVENSHASLPRSVSTSKGTHNK